MTDKETHLGDDVYVSFDGYEIWLRDDGGENAFTNAPIGLGPDTFNALVKYGNALYARITGESND